MAAQIIKIDGSIVDVEPKNGTDFSLAELKEVVGGYIELTYTKNGRYMVVNEEGKLQRLPYNAVATGMHKYGDTIVGDVLVCETDMIK